MQYNPLSMQMTLSYPIKYFSTYKMLPFHTIDVLKMSMRFFKVDFAISVTYCAGEMNTFCDSFKHLQVILQSLSLKFLDPWLSDYLHLKVNTLVPYLASSDILSDDTWLAG